MLDFRQSLINSNLRKVLKRLHYPLEVMLVRARWYAAYPLSFRHLEEMMQSAASFLLTSKRDLAAARRYLERAINLHGLPEKITIGKSGSNTAAIRSFNVDACVNVELRQSKHLNNIVAQDHRAVKRITSAMLGFKSFWSAQKLIACIETMHRVKMGQLHCPSGLPVSAADQFYSLAI
jgi:putative transposase